jgi:cysteine desulfurase / selenocysteine lyase
MEKIIYFDNATTTFPKPTSVYESVLDFMQTIGASPGRSSHNLAHKASIAVFETREKCALLFNIADAGRIVFTANATESINLALFGILQKGDRVIVSAMEHNSVMRPLRRLTLTRGIDVSVVPCDPNGLLEMDKFERIVTQGIKMVVINHASNVNGTIQPLERIGALTKANDVLFLADCAQSAGICPLDVAAANIDLLAFSGHKCLYGPQGTGGLYIKDGLDFPPLKFGGTGSKSDSDEQPDFLPDKFESGTLNGPGIAGLGAGIDFVLQKGTDALQNHGRACTARFCDALREAGDAIRIVGFSDVQKIIPVVSCTANGLDAGALARKLNDQFGICCRPGLHCAPNAHRTLGTFPQGTIRFSFGAFTTFEEIDVLTSALLTKRP